jgi:two-component system, LytTR family, response regulator
MNSAGSPTLRTLIVDDEALGRDVVRHMLKRHVDIEVVGEAANGVQALAGIREHHPQLVFLDIRMPKLGGLDLLESLDAEAPPAIVFVTAHDEYAVKAFERCALDYLLKPFDQERFDATLTRVRGHFRNRDDADFGRRLREFISTRAPTPAASSPVEAETGAGRDGLLTRFVIKDASRVFFVPVESADWLEASGNYVALHVAGKTHLIHETLLQLERVLDPQKFLRIHRSTIVNVNRIKEMQPYANGEFIVILHDGTRLKLSRSFRERANEVLGLD